MAGNGGKRPGAGRKPGIPNKASAAREAQVKATGETPLDYMLRVMRDPSNEHGRRDEMAKACAPYVHPKLAAVEMTGKDGEALIPERELSETDVARAIAFTLAKGINAKPTEH